MISIIIPTLNEEKLLPRLLADIKKQTFTDYEVIVADAHSSDRTREIASDHGCRIVDGGMPGYARNKAAEHAKGEYLVFFDSDVSIKPNFLRKAFGEFEERYLDAAAADVIPDNVEENKYKVIFDLYNAYIRYAQFVNPGALGSFIMMTRRLFDRLGGFNEEIKLGEDFDLVKRAAKLSKFRILESVSITVSVRRIEKEGIFKYVTRNIRSELYRLFVGEITDDRFEYEFGNYDARKEKKQFKRFLKNLKEKLKNAKLRDLFEFERRNR
ncbi:MAG: glycosyltransferase [Nanoarchaeota archaeon]